MVTTQVAARAREAGRDRRLVAGVGAQADDAHLGPIRAVRRWRSTGVASLDPSSTQRIS